MHARCLLCALALVLLQLLASPYSLATSGRSCSPLHTHTHTLLAYLPPACVFTQSDLTAQELQRFLGRMVEEGKLEVAGGQYRIRAAA